MIETEKILQLEGSGSSSKIVGAFTSLISRVSLWNKLTKSKEARARFVESNLDRTLAYQIRSLRERENWTQAAFADRLGINHANNVSARLENPHYGKHTLSTLKKIAATCDVALVVWFVPFSRFVDWVTGTQHLDYGLRPAFYNVPEFEKDALEKAETIAPKPPNRDAEASGKGTDAPKQKSNAWESYMGQTEKEDEKIPPKPVKHSSDQFSLAAGGRQ